MRIRTARRTHGFTESVIRGMTRLANEHGAINLSQGFPNFPCPDVLKDAAARAIRDDVNQYAITWGAARLRNALAAKYQDWYHMAVDPMTQVTVTCGATEAMASALLGVVDRGDEVVVFEPFYENYGPDAILCDAKPVFVPMPPVGPIDLDRLANVEYVGRPAFGQENSTVSMFKLDPDGKGATRITVKLGRSSVNAVEILGGLNEGDQVILSDMSRWDNVDRIRLE